MSLKRDAIALYRICMSQELSGHVQGIRNQMELPSSSDQLDAVVKATLKFRVAQRTTRCDPTFGDPVPNVGLSGKSPEFAQGIVAIPPR
jgi:hypothetical protein